MSALGNVLAIALVACHCSALVANERDVQAPPSLDDMWDGTARFSLVCAQMKASKIHCHTFNFCDNHGLRTQCMALHARRKNTAAWWRDDACLSCAFDLPFVAVAPQRRNGSMPNNDAICTHALNSARGRLSLHP